ncbi:MAG: methyltransferase [Cyclobacteriaceae bacterium]|nr:methyltransferase [Cyclobacteriaceae bacterium]
MPDVLGEALVDYYNGKADTLWINNKYGSPEEMPIEVFFREKEELTTLEQKALLNCKGVVLDVGAAAGAISLMLQDDFDLTAIESSEGACQVMKALGIRNGIVGDIFDYNNAKFDTLILLMNGIGLVGTIDNLPTALLHFKSLLTQKGQILLDSSDISYLYEGKEKPKHHYYGQIQYQYEYKNKKGDWFNWLYIDRETLQKQAAKVGLHCELLFEDENDQYLVKLTNK